MLIDMDTVVDVGTHNVRGLVLRPERPADTRAVAVAHLAAFRKGHAGILPYEVLAALDAEVWVQRRRERLAEPVPDLGTLIAEVDAVIVGHITFGPDPTEPDRTIGRVWACYLHPDWWGSSIADAMMRAALATLPETEIRLWMLEGNHRAGRFYQRHGFRPDGARDKYRPSGWEADYPMVRYALHRDRKLAG